MRFLKGAAASVAIAAAAFAAFTAPAAAKWPMDKPVTIVVPYPAGTGADLLGRVIADGLNKKYGITVQIENRAGASGNIGQNYVAKAAPDGYTWLVTTPGPAANNKMTFKELSYDPLTDFSYVSQISEDVLVLIAGPNVKGDLKEFIANAKANPDKVNIGHPGLGSYAHMTELLLQENQGIKFNIVTYKGAPQMIPDMLGGTLDAVMDLSGSYMPQINSGQLRVLGVAGAERRADLNAPTFLEVGINLTSAPWLGFEGTKGVTTEIVNEMNAAIAEIMKTPSYADKLKGAGIYPKTNKPEEFAKQVRDEMDKWRPIITKYNIRAE
jgi:tripartite-type tricarboxylate transporter receptor subunit TctC